MTERCAARCWFERGRCDLDVGHEGRHDGHGHLWSDSGTVILDKDARVIVEPFAL